MTTAKPAKRRRLSKASTPDLVSTDLPATAAIRSGVMARMLYAQPAVDPSRQLLAVADLETLRNRTRLNRRLPQDTVLGGPADRRLLKLEGKNGRDDILPFAMLAQGVASGTAVCKLQLSNGGTGTGFLVAADILLTNHHVLPSAEAALEAICIFAFELDHASRSLKQSMSFRLKPQALFITSGLVDQGGLDYTFVGIDPVAAQTFGHLPISRGSSKLSKGEAANLIHHPDGEPKAVSIQDNRVLADQGLLLGYLSDTEFGSSGAPVFNNRWEAVGLHFGADTLVGVIDERGYPADYLNLATKMSAVAVDLERRAQTEIERRDATAALATFRDTDTLLGGYFGALGRPPIGSNPREMAAALYAKGHDIDIGFLAASRVASDGSPRLSNFVKLIAELCFDILILEGCAEVVALRVAQELRRFGLHYQASPQAQGAIGPDAVALWNTQTVQPLQLSPEWPADSEQDFAATGGTHQLAAFTGPLFDRRPRRFRFASLGDSARLVDVLAMHFDRPDVGSQRRRLAAKVLGVAVERARQAEPSTAAVSLVLGGRCDVDLAQAELGLPFDSAAQSVIADDARGAGLLVVSTRQAGVGRVWFPPELKIRPDGAELAFRAPARPYADTLPGREDFQPLCLRLSFAALAGPGLNGGVLSDATQHLLDAPSSRTSQ